MNAGVLIVRKATNINCRLIREWGQCNERQSPCWATYQQASSTI
ncbi:MULTISPECIES: hypothetical protein [unclassified Scytonema]